MGGRSKGFRSKGKGKLKKHPRERGHPSTNRAIQELPIGTKVAIIIEPSIVKGQPHHRYHGRVGVVSERRGRAYVVDVSDGGTVKSIISRPEHLRMVRA